MSQIYLPLGEGAMGYSTTFDSPQPQLPEGKALAMPVQTHTVNIAVAESADFSPDTTDGLISLRSDVAVGVRTADCVPVLLHAPDIRAIAAIHAGWRGTVGGIVERCIERLKGLGADPSLMYAAIGPCICGRCYETGAECAAAFRDAGLAAAIDSSYPREHIDLPLANLLQLERSGLERSRIHLSGVCTFEEHRLPSWRRDEGTKERLISYVYLLP